MLLLLPHLAMGQQPVIDLYTGEALVASQDSAERRRALPLALENVLQKLSGLRTFEDYPLVEPALANASSILVAFHYENLQTSLADGSEGSELRLVANFSRARVDDLARALQLPSWQPKRAPIDLWVVVDDGLDRRIFPVEFAYAWQSMDEIAGRRGLSVNWPAPDDEGLYAIDAQLLWGGYAEDLGPVQQGGVMIAAVRREGPEWGVRNNLSYSGEEWTWRIQDIDLQSALAESLQQAIDQVAAANTIAASDLGTWVHEMTVTGLKSADDYRRCLGYLQGLNVVSHASVVSARPGSIVFRLELNALPQYLDEALASAQIIGFDEEEGHHVLQP